MHGLIWKHDDLCGLIGHLIDDVDGRHAMLQRSVHKSCCGQNSGQHGSKQQELLPLQAALPMHCQ